MRPMDHAVPRDTDPAAQAVQDGIYLAMTGAERVAIAFRLSAAARQLTMDGIRRRHPEYTDEQVRMALLRLLHGDELLRTVWPDRALVQP
jgi:hypothetical protein